MKKLDLSKCKNNEEVVKKIAERVSNTSLDDLLEKVNENFVYQESHAKVVYVGLCLGMNVFLSGPGGYGKSTLVKFILDYFGIPRHTIVGYKDMPVDALLGIPNMQRLIQDSEYELDFSKSIFGKRGVLIGEEFTDILPSTAAALKDVLTEKGLRLGEHKTESYISSMIICANKSSEEIVDDESKKALYDERFPLKSEVVWCDHFANRYLKLLQLKFKDAEEVALYFLAKLFEVNSLEHNNIITPRKAIDITRVFLEKGIDFISGFSINMDSINEIKQQAKIEHNRRSKEKYLQEIQAYINNLNSNSKQYFLNVIYALYKLSTIKVEENYIEKVNNMKTDLEAKLQYAPAGVKEDIKFVSKIFDNL